MEYEAIDDRLRDIVTCTVCLDILNCPKSLVCFHSFCGVCIDGLSRSSDRAGWIKCPSCRKLSMVSEIKPNHQTNSLVEIYHQQVKLKAEQEKIEAEQGWMKARQVRPKEVKGKIKTGQKNLKKQLGSCLVCEDDQESIYRCIECKLSMCERCRQAHLRFPVSSHHNVPLEAIICPTHANSELSKYCFDCDDAICDQCCHEKHNKHQTSDIDKALERNREMISQEIGLVCEVNSSRQAAVRQQIEQLKKGQQQVTTELMRLHQIFLKKVNEDHQNLQEQLQHVVNIRMEELQQSSQQVEMEQQGIEDFKTLLNPINKENTQDVLQTIETLKKIRTQATQKIKDWETNLHDLTSNNELHFKSLENTRPIMETENLFGSVEWRQTSQISTQQLLLEDSMAHNAGNRKSINKSALNSQSMVGRMMNSQSSTAKVASSQSLTSSASNKQSGLTSDVAGQTIPGTQSLLRFINRSCKFEGVSVNKIFRCVLCLNNTLWVPDEAENCVRINSLDLVTRFSKIEHEQLVRPLQVIRCGDEVLIVAKSGLFVVDSQGTFQYILQEGFFVSAAWSGDCLVAMKKQSRELCIFGREPVMNRWSQTNMIDCGFKVCVGDSCLLHGDTFYFVQKARSCTVYCHVLGSTNITTIPLRHRLHNSLSNIYLCAVDVEGCLLVLVSSVTDSVYHVYVLTNGELLPVPLPSCHTVPVYVHASDDNVDNMWLVHESRAGSTTVRKINFNSSESP